MPVPCRALCSRALISAIGSSLHIRQLERADAAAYHALRLRMLRVYPDAFTSAYEEDALKPLAWAEKRLDAGKDAPHDFVLGAFAESGEMIGSVGITVETKMKQRHKALLFGMYVVPEAAARGVGRALLADCLERARAIPGLEQVYLSVTASNERARKMYEAAGFETFGVEERAIKVGSEYFAKAHMTLRFGAVSSLS
jgi:ribosomal protein S18 acetylase RimI-like enzyme